MNDKLIALMVDSILREDKSIDEIIASLLQELLNASVISTVRVKQHVYNQLTDEFVNDILIVKDDSIKGDYEIVYY